MTTLPMQYYGRGSARILMPRAVTRSARREWIISPSFMILVVSLAFFTLYKLTFKEPLKLKRPRTIIVLSQAPSIPKPTVKEKLTFFKVVKDAAEKSAEPRKKELKRVLETPAIQPKKPVPPPAAKPIKRKTPENPVPEKKAPAALAAQQTPPKRRILPVSKRPVTPTSMPRHTAPEPTPHPHPTDRAPLKKKEIALMTPSLPVTKSPLELNQPLPKASPVTQPSSRLTPVQPVTAQKLKAQPFSPTSAVTPMAPPQKSFSPLTIAGKAPGKPAGNVTADRRPRLLARAPRKGEPAPALNQLSPPSPIAPTSAPPTKAVSTVPAGRHNMPALETTSSPLPSPPLAGTTGDEEIDVNTVVLIQGSTLGESLRVQNLKEEIYWKIRYMTAGKNPYTYRIHNYQCTVVINGGEPPTATLTFEPSDAPFEVVSALERLLPRRTK